MNERIQKLADQAEVWNADGDKCEVDLEKFAELIVKECVSAIPLDMDNTEFLRVMRAVKNTFRN